MPQRGRPPEFRSSRPARKEILFSDPPLQIQAAAPPLPPLSGPDSGGDAASGGAAASRGVAASGGAAASRGTAASRGVAVWTGLPLVP